MEFWSSFLPIVIYLLLIALLVIGIILGIKTIITMDKLEHVVDSVNDKVESLNGVFSIIDFTTDKIATMTDKALDVVSGLFSRFFPKSKNKKEDE